MKKEILFVFGMCSLCAHSSILDLSSSMLDLTGADTASSTYSTALSVKANTGGDVLVIGTFSAEASDKTGVGSWQLNYGAQNSKAITRTLGSKNDKGIASVAHVFSGVTGGDLVSLQHNTTAGGTLTTFGANLVAIPLSVSTGEKLNYGLHQQNSGFSMNSTTFVGTGVKTTVRVDRASDNGVYMAASFNSKAITAADTGVWQLQYRKVGDEVWIDTGNEMNRAMKSVDDVGAVTLYSLEEGLPPGEYEIQLAGKSATGETIETLNGTLAAVALSYTNAVGGGYFDGFSVEENALSKDTDDPLLGAQAHFSFDEATNGLFASMSFNSAAGNGANQTGAFDLLLTNATSSFNNQENQRFFDDITDYGSGASAGAFTNLVAGDYSLFGRYSQQSGPVSTSNVTLVGFSTEAIPEPAVVTLIVGFGGVMLFLRRIFAK